jgi:beta-phosphoglucomutase family hydrolase
MPFPFSAVLFDLDGVVIDTTELHYRVWTEFAHKHGYSPTREELILTNGRRAAENIRNWLGADLDEAEIATLTAERETHFFNLLETEPVDAVAGVREFIASLQRAAVPFAVATSAVPSNAELSLKRVGLADAFNIKITAADVHKGKPHPECYLKAASKLGVAPEKCLVIEDSLSGIRAAKAAGAKCLALATTFPADVLMDEKPDWIAKDFTELPEELLPAR